MKSEGKQNPNRIPPWGKVTLGALLLYLFVAYLVMPQIDSRRARHDGDFVKEERLTQTGSGLPGDPLNIALVGSRDQVVSAMQAAGWLPGAALGFDSSVRIAVDTVIDRPDPNAPLSNLYLYGRKEDLAFEKPVGHSPRERHHVRFWLSKQTDGGLPVWIGGATHDIGVELSRTTGQVTHHISPDVDAERDLILADLNKSNRILSVRWVDEFHKIRQGHNGGGDPWQTDGRLPVAILSSMTTER
jgi:hypothetical protein